MSDYISRETALKAIFDSANRILEPEDPANESTIIYLIATSNARDAVKDVPAADVRPVERGEWVDKDYLGSFCLASCSACGKRLCGERIDTGFGLEHSFPNFCPHCGADMRGAT